MRDRKIRSSTPSINGASNHLNINGHDVPQKRQKTDAFIETVEKLKEIFGKKL